MSILAAQKDCQLIKLIKTPSHTSLRRWINQAGYYKLTRPKEKAKDWIYFIDNSVRIENRKVCLILGARASQLKKGKYLSYEDLEPIEVRIINKNADLEEILNDAIAKTGPPLQISSDTGSDIMPSIKKTLSQYPETKHVPDIMHQTGNMLKKKLDKDKRWIKFIKLVTTSKNKLKQSALCFLCPPNLRGKSRFLNAFDVIDWGNRALTLVLEIEKSDPHYKLIHEKLGWLIKEQANLALFTELFELTEVSKEIVRKLHIEKGLDKVTEEFLNEYVRSDEGRLFAKGIVDFIKNQCEKGVEGYLLVGSSEIIESAFSKLKLLDRECGNSGFTSSVLGIAACFGKTDCKSLAKAFEEYDQKDIDMWSCKYVGETIQKKRRKVLKKKKTNKLGPKLERFFEEKDLIKSNQM